MTNDCEIKNAIRGRYCRFMFPKLFTLILLILARYCAQGQVAIPAAGGKASSKEGSVSYSVGQVDFTTAKSEYGRVSEGVQQTYEISVISGLDEAKDFTLSCIVYPNPVIDYLTLKVDEKYILKLSYQIYTLDGKLIETKVIQSSETPIGMKTLRSQIYLLRVYDTQPALSSDPAQKRILKTFKIIKS